MQQRLKKGLSALVATIILLANAAPVISYAADNLKSQEELEKQKITTNNSNVEFDVYYDGGLHTKEIDINSQEESVNVRINVKNAGYLKDITVDFNGSNFNITQSEGSKAQVDSEKKTVVFDQINNGSSVEAKVNISAIIDNQISTQDLAKDNEIKLTAKYVNANGKEESIEKTIVIQTIWTMLNKVESNLAYNIDSYYTYKDGDENKLIVFASATSGMKDGSLPIKNTSIEMQAPQLNKKYPEEVFVSAKNTVATNGDLLGTSFAEENYTYNKEDGKLNISVDNKEQNGNINWTKNVLDEYDIAYVYTIEDEETIDMQESAINKEATSRISLYGSNEIVENNVSENVDNISQTTNSITTLISTVKTLNKGYMYTNKKTAEENKNETEYEVTYNTNIPYSDIIEKLIINVKEDNALVDDTVLKTGSGLSYIKTVKISKEQFDKILGEEGSITVKNTEGTTLGTITKDTTDYTLNIENSNLSSIIIETSKPITEGNIYIYIGKAIKKELTYTESQIKSLTSIKIESETTAQNASNVEVAKVVNEATITLEEPTQKAQIEISPSSISTTAKDQQVTINVTLESDSLDDLLYKNPKITINLPQNIDVFAVIDTKLLFEDELQLTNAVLSDNEDGTKRITVELSGEQTKYNNVAAKGATISITALIVLNEETPTSNRELKATIENQGQPAMEISTGVKYVAPSGVVTTTQVTGTTLGTITATNQDVSTLISAEAEAQDVTFNMNVTNNYLNNLDNIIILGRIPTDETTQFTLKGGINVEGIASTIYYSENQNATTNLSDQANAWKTSVSDFSNIKSYMIVLNDYVMEEGASFKFSYTTTIPANVGFEKELPESYEIYFNNNLETGTVSDKVTAPKINFLTGEDVKLSVSIKVKDKSDVTLLNRVNVTYELTITNQSSTDANGVTARIYTSGSATYIDGSAEYILAGIDVPDRFNELLDKAERTEEEQVELDLLTADINAMKAKNAKGCKNVDIGTIKGNETITREIVLAYNKSSAEQKIDTETDIILDHEVIANAKAETVDLGAATFNVNTQFLDTGANYMVSGSKIDYLMTVNSFIGKLDNTEVTINLPKELNYINAEITRGGNTITEEINIENSNNVLTINLGQLKDQTTILLHLEVGNLDEGVYQKEVIVTGKAKSDKIKEFDIPEASLTINNPTIAIEQTSNIPDGTSIKGGEEFSYIFTIQNLSNISLQSVKLTDYIPNNVIYKSFTITSGDKIVTRSSETDENGNPIIEFYLGANATVVATLNVQAEAIGTDTTISNRAILSNDTVGERETNVITHIISKYDGILPPGESGGGSDNENGSGTNTPTTGNRIVGTVWIDGNEDGIKDVQETKMSGVEVMLLDNNTGETAVTEDNKQAITTTDEDGAYMFGNLEEGSYTVIFLYDSENYKATEFEKVGVDETLTSKAIDKRIGIDGEEQVAAVTEELNLNSDNIFDINLGLISNKKFDLKLDKVVTEIKLNNSEDSTTHTYNSDFAKIDIAANDVESTTMIVEYKFTITNEGDVPGYVKKLADYVPSELKFSSELNTDWYETDNGTIINNSLANKAINPGESVEVKLTLTKSMTNDAMGIVIKNTAEIYEASNDYGLQDKDSTPGNKQTNEDDISTANVLTSVKTGQPVYYVVLTITVLGILIVGIYTIKKTVIK